MSDTHIVTVFSRAVNHSMQDTKKAAIPEDSGPFDRLTGKYT